MALTTMSAPFYWLSDLPERIDRWGDDNLVSRERLAQENIQLRADNDRLLLLLQGQLALLDENERLRGMLNATARLEHGVITSQLIGVAPDPVRQILVVDKGEQDGVSVGLPVLDRLGVAGQVIDVSLTT